MPKLPAFYDFGPFSLSSDIQLPELPPSKTAGLPVRITLGRVPETIPEPTFQSPYCIASRHELLLHIDGVASYYIGNGKKVVVQPAPDGNDLDIRGYLLGHIFAILCHQRRLLPLHASAVRMGSGAVAFLGDSGAGKSTLAAFLVARGFPLVADDVCLLDPDAPAQQRVLPVAPWLKLWRTSLEALGQPQDGLSRTFHDEDKYRVPVGDLAMVEEQRLPLTALVFLKRNDDPAAKTVLHPLSPAQSMVEAMRFTYQQYLLGWLGLQEEHFKRSSMAIAGAIALTCHRPWGFGQLEALAEQLEDQFGRPATSTR
jgi:hypothetical protein